MIRLATKKEEYKVLKYEGAKSLTLLKDILPVDEPIGFNPITESVSSNSLPSQLLVGNYLVTKNSNELSQIHILSESDFKKSFKYSVKPRVPRS